MRTHCFVVATAVLIHVSAPRAARAEEPSFARDVRPILAAHCFKCHGPDEARREAGLRLDSRDAATRPAESGARAIVPGRPDQSELVRRIFAADESERMPPPHAKQPLAAAQRETLRKWIAAGAEYQPHWAFTAPRWPQIPLAAAAGASDSIDALVRAKLAEAGLTSAPPADKATLIRRASLDLIGLPPTPDEVERFLADPAPDAYERLIDRLLAQPAYGERWARRWLDLARYADTNGYEKDRVRSIWPYRDWVIQALNADQPFDRFTIEQIAGDMLPQATPDQRIATGFHRNTMLNEEGGIDPLEFRYHAMVDRVNTTAVVWLGLTLGCAQCHAHKFDPISQQDYYRFLALLNNADEPEYEAPAPAITARQAELRERIAALEAKLPERFPAAARWEWNVVETGEAVSAAGAALARQGDGSWLAGGAAAEADTLTLTFTSDLPEVAALKIEALTDQSLPQQGPGRGPHGNFVLSELQATVQLPKREAVPAKLAWAEADFEQQTFPAAHALDGNPKTGWGVQGPTPFNVDREARFFFERPQGAAGARWTIKLDQQFGGKHTLGRVRVSLGRQLPSDDARPEAIRRREHFEQKFRAWREREAAGAVVWQPLRPVAARANVPLLTILDDNSILASGDQTKRDVYDLKFRPSLPRITAIRLEALPDERLPRRGPGRIYYEGPFGDFFLSEIALRSDAKTRPFAQAAHSYAFGGLRAADAIDGDPQTGWGVNGGQGRSHVAIFQLAEPLLDADEFELSLLFERFYAAGLGRFRISVSGDLRAGAWRGVPPEIEAILALPADRRTPEQEKQLQRHFLAIAPELAVARQEIDALRKQLPALPLTLVMQERPPENPRATFVQHRGEFLQPREEVQPASLPLLPPLPAGRPANRLALAEWLVDARNPLVARVTVNRHWGVLFGRGLARTTDDFGYQGELPTHPELLDWLALEFVRREWSVKALHRALVTSGTYRQSSAASAEMLARDPQNLLLARAPRVRLEAEQLRDAALRASGLLSHKLGGPSVFPPQPPGITSEGTYGPLAWKVSQGEDRYRRGLYTFSKRTAPYAMFIAFDGPSGEACLPRREASNTPLQSLTLLNDEVFVEAARALGRELAAADGTTDVHIALLVRRCLAREPSPAEQTLLKAFFEQQLRRLQAGELDAAAVAGAGAGDARASAAWTLLARAIFNLDEFVTKE